MTKEEILEQVMSENFQANYDWTDNMMIWKEEGKFKLMSVSDQQLLNELIEQGQKAINTKSRLLFK